MKSGSKLLPLLTTPTCSNHSISVQDRSQPRRGGLFIGPAAPVSTPNPGRGDLCLRQRLLSGTSRRTGHPYGVWGSVGRARLPLAGFQPGGPARAISSAQTTPLQMWAMTRASSRARYASRWSWRVSGLGTLGLACVAADRNVRAPIFSPAFLVDQLAFFCHI